MYVGLSLSACLENQHAGELLFSCAFSFEMKIKRSISMSPSSPSLFLFLQNAKRNKLVRTLLINRTNSTCRYFAVERSSFFAVTYASSFIPIVVSYKITIVVVVVDSSFIRHISARISIPLRPTGTRKRDFYDSSFRSFVLLLISHTLFFSPGSSLSLANLKFVRIYIR